MKGCAKTKELLGQKHCVEEVAKVEAKPEEFVPADEEGRRAYMQQIENLLVRSTVASDSKIETQDGGQGTN